MSGGPLGTRVAPGNDAFGGGTLTPAANPVAVGGSYGQPGASGFPAPGTPQILSARNNSGSNVRIPYARLVPMRGGDPNAKWGASWTKIPGLTGRDPLEQNLNGRPVLNEYDGLESGELAWILGRRFFGTTSAEDAGGNLTDVPAVRASAHMMGAGYGPDRMQRLAYTDWVEHFFRANYGAKVINLHTLNMTSAANTYLSGELKKYDALLAGCSVLGSVDIPSVMNALFPTPEPESRPANQILQYASGAAPNVRDNLPREGLSSGIFVMEKGPFLRGKINEDMPVSIPEPSTKSTTGRTIHHTVERNLGDNLAFDALYSTMRADSFFDWSPDGMCLSKLESPSGDPLSSAELDARQAQLYNVCIQGPAIAKTWTGDPKMQTMPMDRVFICVVADVVSTVGGASDGIGSTGVDTWTTYGEYASGKTVEASGRATGAAKPNRVANLAALDAAKLAANTATDTAYNAAAAALAAIGGGAGYNGDYEQQLAKLFDNAAKLSSDVPSINGSRTMTTQWTGPKPKSPEETELENARTAIDGFFAQNASFETDLDTTGEAVRTGNAGVTKSVMTNFRLMRCTSSFLAQYSAFKKGDKEARCGLRIGAPGGDATAGLAAEYIIGAWCIGSVIDNAASRSSVGHLVRVAPASMAININVNVEWWSADKLYRNYMDVDGSVFSRNIRSVDKAAQDARAEGTDVAEVNRKEPLAWPAKP